MKQISNKFKITKPVNIFEELLSEDKVETTIRKIYAEDYELLKKMAHFKNRKMLHLLDEIFLVVEPLCLDFKYEQLPTVLRPAYATNSHKSIRIPQNFIQFIEDHSIEEQLPMKIMLGRYIRYYAQNRMPEEFFEMVDFEKRKKHDIFLRGIK